MSQVIYIETSDENKVVRLPGNEREGSVTLVDRKSGMQFDLTNTLNTSAMREAREVAKAHGLKLSNVKRMAVATKR